MRRSMIGAAVALACLLPLSGCMKMVTDEPVPVAAYASFLPLYMLAQPVLDGASNVELRCLTQPQDGCLRNYELSQWDEVRLGGANVVIMGGAGLESFGDGLLSMENGPAVISVLEGAPLINAEVAQSSIDEEVSHFATSNPWYFLSIHGAMEIVESIETQMVTIDPQNAARYEKNAHEALHELDSLLARCEQILPQSAEYPPVAVMHEGLEYIVRDFDLQKCETIEREPGSDIDPGEMEDVLNRLKNANARVALIEKQAPDRLVRELEGVGIIVVKLDTLTTGGGYDFDRYLNAMSENIEAIASALERSEA